MRALLLVALLLTAGLAGCLGSEEAPPAATDASPRQPTLPQDLTMEGAEAVAYTESEVIWRVQGTVTGITVETTEPGPIHFDMPGGVPVGLDVELAYEDDPPTTIGFEIRDGQGEQRCIDDPRTFEHRRGTDYVRCSQTFEPLDEDGVWSVQLQAEFPADHPFALTLHLFAAPAGESSARDAEPLPDGLSLEGADLLTYTANEVVWTWEAQVPLDATEPGLVGTRLTMPANLIVHLDITLALPAPTNLGLEVQDHNARAWCTDTVEFGPDLPGAVIDAGLSCRGITGPHRSPGTWEILVFDDAGVDPTASLADGRFTAQVRLTSDLAPLPTPEAVADPAPGCDGQRPAVYQTTSGDLLKEPGSPVVPCLFRTGVETKRSTIDLASDGTIHHFPKLVDADPDTGLATEPTALTSSTDGGSSWTEHAIEVGPIDERSPAFFPYMVMDPATDRIFADQYNIYDHLLSEPDTSTLSYSDDGGETWTSTRIEGSNNAWQSLAVGPTATSSTDGYPNAVYRCARWLPLTLPSADHWGLGCHQSLDGGDTWTFQGYLAPPEEVHRMCDMTFGDAVVDPDGRLMMPVAWCAIPRVAISEDEGRTWSYHKVADLPVMVRHETLRGPSIDVDREGTIYHAWLTEDGTVRVAYSQEDGQTWSDPPAIEVSGIETMRNAHLAVGAPGRVAIAYYGTDGGSRPVGVGADQRVPAWHGYMTVTTDLFADDPVFATAQVNDPETPLLVGSCDGRRCQGASLISVARIGPDGAPYANFVDGCGAAWTTCEPDDGDLGEAIVAKLWGVDLWDDVDPNGPYPDDEPHTGVRSGAAGASLSGVSP